MTAGLVIFELWAAVTDQCAPAAERTVYVLHRFYPRPDG